jgi:hypothetical protein
MLLTILAMALMGRLILSVNSNVAYSGEAIEMAEYRIAATSLGTSILEQAQGLSFDEATVNKDIDVTTTLTAATSLGFEAGEVYPDSLDDFDDFNNFAKIDTLQRSAIYRTTCRVQYVTIGGGAVAPTTTKTFNKMITVNVSSPSLTDTLRFYSVFSYWYFR